MVNAAKTVGLASFLALRELFSGKTLFVRSLHGKVF